MVYNLTPHDVRIVKEHGDQVYPPHGQIARVEVSAERIGTKDGIPIFRTIYGDVTGLPAPEAGTEYIVSQVVANACPERTDLLYPYGLIRDEQGRVVGCEGLTGNVSEEDFE